MSGELVTVATFNDPIQAAMARNYLEAGGVRALLLDEMTVLTGLLGNAIGGIKLQVPASDMERAEFLLSDLPGDDPEDDESLAIPATAFATPETAEELREERDGNDPESDEPPAVPVTAFATRETAEELREQREFNDPKRLAVERILRTTVFGLLFWPLQFYALWMLMTLRSVEGKVSPRQRWKVWASLLLNLPLMSLVFVAIFLVASCIPSLGGKRLQFPNEGFSIRFPHKPGRSSERFDTPVGAVERVTYTVADDRATYRVSVDLWPNTPGKQQAEQMLDAEIQKNHLDKPNARLIKREKLELNGFPGREIVFSALDDRGRYRSRIRMYFAGARSYFVQAAWPDGNSQPSDVNHFIESFEFR
jgi:hypothetical protein